MQTSQSINVQCCRAVNIVRFSPLRQRGRSSIGTQLNGPVTSTQL